MFSTVGILLIVVFSSFLTFEEARHVLQLGDVVWTVPTMPFQQTEGLEVFGAGMGGVQVPQG